MFNKASAPLFLSAAMATLGTLEDYSLGQDLRNVTDALPALPKATGYGAQTSGGVAVQPALTRVSVVTDLRDYSSKEKPIEGTLRFETNRPGPTVIILATPGTIQLKEDLVLREPYKTITGIKCPQPGVVLSHGGIDIKTHDIVITDIRIRPGDFDNGQKLSDRDCLTLSGRKDGVWGKNDSVENILIRRVSMQFACDEVFSTHQHVRNVSLDSSILAYGLRYTAHPDVDQSRPLDSKNPKNHHSMALLISPETSNISITGNLFALCMHRMPRVMPGAAGEISNNIFYGFGEGKADKFYFEQTRKAEPNTMEQSSGVMSVIGNCWIYKGDAPKTSTSIINIGKSAPWNNRARIYFENNGTVTGNTFSSEKVDPALDYLSQTNPNVPAIKREFLEPHLLEKEILLNVGARSADGAIDALDQSIIRATTSRTGEYLDTVVEGRTSLNGFNITNAMYSYPPTGRAVAVSFPKQTSRETATRYSALETWLWNK